MSQDNLWWQEGVIYQVYPRSFSDSNGDGLGDLPGITSRLDYIASLGVEAIWLSPFYPTPDADFGYDVSDHTAVDPRFGTLQDFDLLLQQAHQRGLKVILDVVLNHTSDQHPWFTESRTSKTNPRRDWYIWHDPSASGGPPNNWQASFGGSAWQLDPATGQYYLHSFLAQQPDVNWHNPALRQAQLDVFRFWLERGVDGFRLDVFNAFFKDQQLRSNPEVRRGNPTHFGLRAFDRQDHIYDMNRPEMDGLLNELRTLLDSYPARYAVGETYVTSTGQTLSYIGPDRLHAAFTFDLFESNISFPWNPAWLLRRIEQRDTLFDQKGIWPTTVLGNHDQRRTASRYTPRLFSNPEDDSQALIAMALLLTLRGTPYLYYGEEIGMRDIDLKYSEIMDPPGKKYWPVYKGRDGCRSPMQWSAAPHAGFSNATPWIKTHPNYTQRNVSAQEKDPASLLNRTRQLISLRKQYACLRQGAFRAIPQADSAVLAYERFLSDNPQSGQKIQVYLNFSSRSSKAITLPQGHAKILFTNTNRQSLSGNQLTLQPHEVLITGCNL